MASNSLRIVFMGTPDFAAAALASLLGTGHEIVAVYSQPPRPKGRGHVVQKSPVHILAEKHGIEVFTPKSLKAADAQAEFAAHGADVAVVAAYGLILPKAVLDAPKFGCLNIHASLLPRWRGASPIQRSIWAGDAETGVTIMQMDIGLDTGPMILKESIAITQQTTCSILHDQLAECGARMIVDVLDNIAQHGLQKAQQQDDNVATYAPLLKKEDGRINWAATAQEIDRQLRALNPWPGVYTDSKGQRFKILQADIEKSDVQNLDKFATGEVIDRHGLVKCANNEMLRIVKIQPSGKQAMDFSSAVNGNYIAVGDVFS